MPVILTLAELDAGKRASEAINTALLADPDGARGRWVAIRLEDGRTDGNVYDRRADAVRHQSDEFHACYLKIPPDGITPRAAARYIKAARRIYDAGYRMPDPEANVQILGNLGGFK